MFLQTRDKHKDPCKIITLARVTSSYSTKLLLIVSLYHAM